MAGSTDRDQLAQWVQRELLALRGHKAQPVQPAIPDPLAPRVQQAIRDQRVRLARLVRADLRDQWVIPGLPVHKDQQEILDLLVRKDQQVHKDQREHRAQLVRLALRDRKAQQDQRDRKAQQERQAQQDHKGRRESLEPPFTPPS